MITEKLKAIAIARLKHSEDPNDIADDLELPARLVREWQDSLPQDDLVAIEANLGAVVKLENRLDSQLVTPLHTDILKNVLEETAIDLTKAMALPALNGDMAHAKTIQLLCDGLTKMYTTIVLKGGIIEHNPSGKASSSDLSLFEDMMRD